MTQWRARQVQIAWFLETPLAAEPADLFKLLSRGVSPNSTGTNHAMEFDAITGQSRPAFLSNAQGAIGRNIVSINKQDTRLDLYVQPANSSQAALPPFFTTSEEVQSIIDEYADTLRQTINQVTRVALVNHYSFIVESINDANIKVLDAIGMELSDVKDGSDLTFSVNVRKEIENVVCNRVVKWQVEAFTSAVPTMNMFGQMVINNQKPIYAASMIIDVNTATSSRSEISGVEPHTLISALAREGARIASFGKVTALKS